MSSHSITQLLTENKYPGRGIILGRSADNKNAVLAYFIMGRSENSRNRIFEKTDDGIRTKAFDESKLVDPSLIIYHPVRRTNGITIVTNGDQTDTVRDYLLEGKGFVDALNSRTFEPDAPHYTPRISGILKLDGSYTLSILKSANGNPASCLRQFFDYENVTHGTGHFIHTYQQNIEPLPSFCGEPYEIAISALSAKDFSAEIWSALNTENKISLFVRYQDLSTGYAEDVIINKH